MTTSIASPPSLADQLRLDPQNPWPGLTAFTEQQREYFCGRNDEAGELFDCIKRERLTVLFGKSGLGKTSLLQAGLFPLLRDAAFLPVYIRLNYAADGPSLEEQVRTALELAIAAANLAEVATPQKGEGVWEYLHRRGGNLINDDGDVVMPVLVFDQFEEWFTLGGRQEFATDLRERFMPDLADLVENRIPQSLTDKLTRDRDLARRFDLEAPGCRILVTLREDYLAYLENLRNQMPSLVFVDNRIRLTEMNGRQAFAVVTEPNPDLVEGDVADFIVRFVAGFHNEASDQNPRDVIPLVDLEIAPAILSLFCRQLNEARLAQRLPRITKDLVTAQGVTIIDDFYQQCICTMHPAVRRLIEDRLLTKAGYRDNIDLAQARIDLHEAGVDPTSIDDLVRLRLLQIEEHRGVPRLELTHDVLADPVRRSRVLWEEQEAIKKQQELQQELQKEALAEARKSEQDALRRARFLQKVIAAVAFVSILLAGLLIYALNERRQAKISEATAKANATKAQENEATAAANAHKAEVMSGLAAKSAHDALENEIKAEANARKAELVSIQDEKDKQQAEDKKDKLSKVAREFLDHCVNVSRQFENMAPVEVVRSKSGELESFRETRKGTAGTNDHSSQSSAYESLLMNPGECSSIAEQLHNTLPDDDTVTGQFSLIPLLAADSAHERGDKEKVREFSNAALQVADKLQPEANHPRVKILLARTYVLVGYELADVDETAAKANSDRGALILADLRNHKEPDNFNSDDWYYYGQAYLFSGFYLETLKKSDEAIQAYEASFNADIAGHDDADAVKRGIEIGAYENRLGNSEKALEWYRKSLPIAKKSKDRASVATIYSGMRVALVAEKKYDEGLALVTQRIQSLPADPDDVQREEDIARAYGDGAEVLEAEKQWQQGVDYRMHAVQELSAIKPDAYDNLKQDQAIAYSDLSWDEVFTGQTDKGLSDAQKGITLAEETKVHSTISYVYTDAIKSLSANGRHEESAKVAEQYLQELLTEPEDLQRDRDLAITYGRAAEQNEDLKQWHPAVDDRTQAVAILAALKPDAYDSLKKDLAIAYSDLSWAEAYDGQVDKSSSDAQRGIALAQETKIHSTVFYVYTDAIKSLSANGRYEESAKIAEQYIQELLTEPEDLQRDRDLAITYGRAAEPKEALKQWSQAVDDRTQAVAILAALKPDAYDGQPKDLATAYGDLSWAEIYNGQVAKGITDAQSGIALAEQNKDNATRLYIYTSAIRALVIAHNYDAAGTFSSQHLTTLLHTPDSVVRDRELQIAYRDAVRIDEAKELWPQAAEDYRQQVTVLIRLRDQHAYDDAQTDLASAYGGLSWAEIEAGRFADGLEDAKRGIALDETQTWISINQAHGLLLTGKGSEARALYLKIKDYPRGNTTLTTDITDDFTQLCKLGYTKPEMVSIAHDLGIKNPELSACFAGAVASK